MEMIVYYVVVQATHCYSIHKAATKTATNLAVTS